MSKRVSIRDVAVAAGVSITTVSHALNGKGRLSATTRDRVRRAAEAIGYEPSVHAQGLVTGRSRLLAIQASGFESQALVPQVAYFVDLLNAASAAAFRHGYGLILAPPGCSARDVRRLGVDGAAIVDPLGGEPLLQALREEGKPVVATGRVPGHDDVACVDSDHAGAAHRVLDHLASVGVRRPALLTTGRGPSYVADVGRGYRSWCAAHDLSPMVATVRGVPNDVSSARAAQRLLTRADRPDAIYATLDALAIGALRAARSCGLEVPGDLAIAALTDAAVLRAAAPPITALDLHPEQIGERVIDMLVGLVEGRPCEERPLIPADLLLRESTQRDPRT